jgi:hypothetical protein
MDQGVEEKADSSPRTDSRARNDKLGPHGKRKVAASLESILTPCGLKGSEWHESVFLKALLGEWRWHGRHFPERRVFQR